MARQFFSGNSIEQAVMAAARHHHIEPNQVAYKLREKKHGFVNVRKRIVIEVDPNSPILSEEEIHSRQESVSTPSGESLSGNALKKTRSTDSASTEEGQESSETPNARAAGEARSRDDRGGRDRADSADSDHGDRDGGRDSRSDRGRGNRGRSHRDQGDRHGRRGGDSARKRDVEITEYSWESLDWDSMEIEEGISREMAAFEQGIEKILDVMDIDIEYTLSEGETFEIEFSGEDEKFLTDEDGKVLKAIEHVLPRVVRNLIGKSIPCRADCGGFQAEYEQELMDMAKRAAEEAVATGRSVLLEPMTPADRRIVHLSLVDNVDIDTSSEGGGYMKRVRVMLLDED